jgi:hypothetical protein
MRFCDIQDYHGPGKGETYTKFKIACFRSLRTKTVTKTSLIYVVFLVFICAIKLTIIISNYIRAPLAEPTDNALIPYV